MRVATLLLTALAVALSLTLAAPINTAHYEELETRWNPFHLSSDQKQKLERVGREVVHDVGTVVKTAAPVALSLAPLVLKREEEEIGLLKRISPAHYEELSVRWNPFHLSPDQKQNLAKVGREVGHGAERAWDVLGPTAVNLAAQHYHLVPRDVDEALVARALEFAGAEEELHRRGEMPELFERDSSPIEELERRGLSQGAKDFWRNVGHGAEHVFEQLGPTALEVAANLAKSRGRMPPLA